MRYKRAMQECTTVLLLSPDNKIAAFINLNTQPSSLFYTICFWQVSTCAKA